MVRTVRRIRQLAGRRAVAAIVVVGGLFMADGSATGSVSATEVAIIVNRDNPTAELTLHEATRIFRQERQFWENGQRIYLVMQEAGSQEMAIVLNRIYGMRSHEELKKLWLTMIFREQLSTFPQVLDSNEAVKRFISQVPKAVGFVDAANPDGRVKILRIDGKLPGDSGYPVTDGVLSQP